MDNIYETVVYDGRTKEFRILNLSTGTVYSMGYEKRHKAEQAAEEENGIERTRGRRVKFIQLFDLQRKLEQPKQHGSTQP